MTDLESKDYDLQRDVSAFCQLAEDGNLPAVDTRYDRVLTLLDDIRALVAKEFYGD
jgi:hypothetical protein